MAEASVDERLNAVMRLLNINEFREFQKDVLTELMKPRDVFLSVKTGGGKSLCYEAFQPLWENEKGSRCSVLIVAPLISIMKEQTEHLNTMNLKSTYVGRDQEDDKEIIEGKFKFIFASPESLLSVPKWRDFLTSKNDIKLIVIDEAHTVLNWGEGDGYLEPFRMWYGNLGEIRSLIECPILLITATANKAARNEMKKKFCMKDCFEVIQNPDRDNIKLFLHKYKATVPVEYIFSFLINGLQKEKGDYARHVVFCTSIKTCSEIYSTFRMELGEDIKFVEMYHSKTPETIKEKIKEDLMEPQGIVRVLVATSAAGMGVNFSGVNNVVNFGPPKDMDSFIQQIGRAGRNGEFSMALLIYNGKQCKNIDSDMDAYLKNMSCRRENLLSVYNSKPKPERLSHQCCDVCSLYCACNTKECGDFKHPFYLFDPDTMIFSSSESDE